MTHLIMTLTDLVRAGKKSSAFINLEDIGSSGELEDLDCVEVGNWFAGSIEPPNLYAISIKGKTVTDIITPSDLNYFMDIDIVYTRLTLLYHQLQSLKVPNALKLLSEYPRNDDQFIGIIEWNGERPEVAIMEGLLLGYRPCDIFYYIRTRYLGEKEHALEHNYLGKLDCPHVICFSCASELLSTPSDHP